MRKMKAGAATRGLVLLLIYVVSVLAQQGAVKNEAKKEDDDKPRAIDPELVYGGPMTIMSDKMEEREYPRYSDVFVEYGRNEYVDATDVLEWLVNEFETEKLTEKSILKDENKFHFRKDALRIVVQHAEETKPAREWIEAKREISKGTLLMKIPYDAMLMPEAENECRMTPCETAWSVVREYQNRFLKHRIRMDEYGGHDFDADEDVSDFSNVFVSHLLQEVDDGLEEDFETLHDYLDHYGDVDIIDIHKEIVQKEWPILEEWSEENQAFVNKILGIEYYNNETISGIEPPRFGLGSLDAKNLCEPVDEDFEPWKVTAWNKFHRSTTLILRTALFKFYLRQWNHRLLPMYHLIPRASDQSVNLEHREIYFPNGGYVDYALYASRDIQKGETLILPHHSVAQEFSLTGSFGSVKERVATKLETDSGDDESYHRFWLQTMSDVRSNLTFSNEEFVTWDFFPGNKTVFFVEDADRKYDDYVFTRTSKVGVHPGPPLWASQRDVFQAQYRNLRNMKADVEVFTKTTSSDEKETSNDAFQKQQILRYYELWTESLGRALAKSRSYIHERLTELGPSGGENLDEKLVEGMRFVDDNTVETAQHVQEDSCPSNVGDETCSSQKENAETYSEIRYNSLEDGLDQLHYNSFSIYSDCIGGTVGDEFIYEELETFYNKGQWTRFPRSGLGDDTCLNLDNGKVVHSCRAFWPHVHETIVHYPASFIPKGEMKRVLYVGGGDIIILHEILRYPSLELVVGLELDQGVVRDTFRNYGLQPKFDDPRVRWWFGDGSKSLGILPPKEYFGTFDLVLVDLIIPICRMLRVGPNQEQLEDYMMKLLRPGGILIRQEDEAVHKATDFAKYTIDLDIKNMPHTCHQSFTMGSNLIDFMGQRYDHELKDLVLYEPHVDSLNHTSLWSNYRSNFEPPPRFCSDRVLPVKNILSEGVFDVLEIEDVALGSDDSILVRERILKTLQDLDFSNIVHHDLPFDNHASQVSNAVTSLYFFEEGYVTVRLYPAHNYCALDLQLWNVVTKRDQAVAALEVAVRNGDKAKDAQVSSFEITTGGMFSIRNMAEKSTAFVDSYTPLWCDIHKESYFEPEEYLPVENDKYNDVVRELAPLFSSPDPTVVVLCPDSSNPCHSLEVLLPMQSESSLHIVPIYACSDIKGGNQPKLMKCENDLLTKMQEDFPGEKKIGGIFIDPNSPKELGQIIHRIFANTTMNFETLSHDYAIIAPHVDTNKGDAQWPYQLMERFRIDFVEFNPVWHATTFFGSSTKSPVYLRVEILSVGNEEFYANLISAFRKISEKTSLLGEIRASKQGIISFNPNFRPSKSATAEDYDFQPSLKQWQSQQQVGKQIIAQYEVEAESIGCPKIKEYFDDEVVRKGNPNGFIGYDTGSLMYTAGNGCVIAFTSIRNDILLITFDGRKHVTLNVYTPIEDGKITADRIFHLLQLLVLKRLYRSQSKPIQFDQYPRGYGSIVNFKEDIAEKVNFGMTFDEVQQYIKNKNKNMEQLNLANTLKP